MTSTSSTKVKGSFPLLYLFELKIVYFNEGGQIEGGLIRSDMGPTPKNSASSSMKRTQKFLHLAGRRNLSAPGPDPNLPLMPAKAVQGRKSERTMDWAPAASLRLGLHTSLEVEIGVFQASPWLWVLAWLRALRAILLTMFP